MLRRRRGAAGRSDLLAKVGLLAGLILALFVALCVVWLGFTHLQGRFFILGVPMAAVLLALGVAGWGRAGRAVVAIAVVTAAVPAFGRLHARFGEKLFAFEWSALLGLEELQGTFVSEAYDAALQGDAPLALAGDARAFVYTCR
jgi:hypothetical protein